MKVRTSDGDTVGLITYRFLSRDDDEVEEAVYRLNPNLTNYGAVLPAGVVITLPEILQKPASERTGVWS